MRTGCLCASPSQVKQALVMAAHSMCLCPQALYLSLLSSLAGESYTAACSMCIPVTQHNEQVLQVRL